MKILWITNVLIGDLCDALYKAHPASGGWMEALLDDYKKNQQDEIIVITTERRNDLYFLEKGNVKYYLLPCGNACDFNYKNAKNINNVNTILENETPDLIHIWGTEYTLGLTALNCNKNILSVVYIQGILEVIARYYEAGLSKKELRRAISFRDVVKFDWIRAQKRKYIKKAKLEKQIIEKSGNIISENVWCNAHCKAIAPKVKTHYCKLSIRKEFLNYKWNLSGMENYTIMSNASGYPLKGLHILLKSLKIVAEKYPMVMLRVPGPSMIKDNNLKSQLKQTGYARFIEHMIKEYKLENNIEFLGVLSPEQMGQYMKKTNVFVVPSALENHSSTLKEAMIVGTPCISSYVGGVPEYVKHGENGFLYRFEEYELLAEYICMLFQDKELAIKLSRNGCETITRNHKSDNIYENIRAIYSEVVSQSISIEERL